MHPTPLRTTGIFFPWLDSRSGPRLPLRGSAIIQHTRQDSPGRGIGPSQRPLPDNTKHSQETEFHAPGWIPTRNPSKQAATDSHHRLRGHRVWL